MTVVAGSLFSGIGGAEVGAALAGLPVMWAWQVEIDPFCRSVLEHHFPDTDRSVTDVRSASADYLAPVDILVGGPPCPDFSVAGRGAGLAGDNGQLSLEFFRLVRELRPRVVLMENVTGILARGFGDLLWELASCGYDAEWDCVPASAVGAPHQRDRVWLVAYPHSERRELKRSGRLFDGERTPRGDDADGLGGARVRRPGPDDADAGSPGLEERLTPSGPGSEGHSAWRHPSWRGDGGWVPSSAVRRVDDGLPGGVDRRLVRRRDRARLRALGNAWCPWASVPAWRRVREILDV